MEPHANASFHEHKLEMRFTQEIDYLEGDDELWVRAMSVGSHHPAEGEVTLTVEGKRPDGTSNHVSARCTASAIAALVFSGTGATKPIELDASCRARS